MTAAAIVPAYNEEKTVGNVVRALKAAEIFFAIMVVDDGSVDGTSAAAQEAGAQVLRLEQNIGKGGALAAALAALPEAEVVAFFDADLLGFTAAHARALVAPVAAGEVMMQVGLRDRGPLTWLSRRLPLISGERALRREVVRALPADFWRGFRIELGLAAVCRRRGWPVGATVMPGVSIRTKLQKSGLLRGTAGYLKMSGELCTAYVEAAVLTKNRCLPSTGSKERT